MRIRTSNLHKSNTLLDQTPRSQTLQGVKLIIRVRTIDSVESERLSCLTCDIT